MEVQKQSTETVGIIPVEANEGGSKANHRAKRGILEIPNMICGKLVETGNEGLQRPNGSGPWKRSVENRGI